MCVCIIEGKEDLSFVIVISAIQISKLDKFQRKNSETIYYISFTKIRKFVFNITRYQNMASYTTDTLIISTVNSYNCQGGLQHCQHLRLTGIKALS